MSYLKAPKINSPAQSLPLGVIWKQSCTEQKLKSINALKTIQLRPHGRLPAQGTPEHVLALHPPQACVYQGQYCTGRCISQSPLGNRAPCKEIKRGCSSAPVSGAVQLCGEPAHGHHRWSCLWGRQPRTSWSGILGERRKDEQFSFADVAGMVPVNLNLQEEPVL